MSLNPYSFLLEKLFHDPLRRKKKHRKGSFLEKLQCFALESAFSHHPANLNYATGQEGPHTIVFISAKLPHACVVWVVCALNEFAEDSYLSSCYSPGMWISWYSSATSPLLWGVLKPLGLGADYRPWKSMFQKIMDQTAIASESDFLHHQSLVSISFHLECLLAP